MLIDWNARNQVNRKNQSFSLIFVRVCPRNRSIVWSGKQSLRAMDRDAERADRRFVVLRVKLTDSLKLVESVR